MRRLLLLIVLVAILAFAFVYLRRGGAQSVPEVPAALGEVKEKLGEVGDRLKGTKTQGSVKAALELNRDLQPYDFDVDADSNGVVTLKGELPREDLRTLAGQVAAAVPDVTRVDNQVRVNAQAPAPAPDAGRTVGENLDDKAVEAKVSLAFSLNRDLKGTDVKVDAFKRAVTLSGQVATPAQRQLAVAIAQRTTGVQSVTDRMAVSGAAPAAASPAAGAPTAADPAMRAAAAQSALRANGSLAAYQLRVAVEGDRLVLRGQVKTPAEKDLAGALAREAVGTPVDNEIQIQIGSGPPATL
ncbi:MAG TPA: BON domain-containing protein [Vicinamibacteria bacterium]|nr:BON domain-containing protein [Vicinamibacteria bacterium]